QNIRSEMERICQKRWEKLPRPDVATAGSFFKNLPPRAPGEHRQAIGAFLDQAGAKSLRVGDASVYPRHANVIVNDGSASAQDVLKLAHQMAVLVKERFGIIAEPEVRLIGKGISWQPA
ncbi:MAG TPA: UDP-N-acetylenolpyruvoylglucosamine reductase, partial [bacterium]|nr:UDP-N-acetylenolpyruvoylglucosamine reductase [bacterium]